MNVHPFVLKNKVFCLDVFPRDNKKSSGLKILFVNFLIKDVSMCYEILFPITVFVLNRYFSPFLTFFIRLEIGSFSFSDFGFKERTLISL